MSSCRCCNNKDAYVMAPFCDRCFLEWNPCCEFRVALDLIIEQSAEDVCMDLGYFPVPFDEQIKHINESIRKVKKLESDIMAN